MPRRGRASAVCRFSGHFGFLVARRLRRAFIDSACENVSSIMIRRVLPLGKKENGVKRRLVCQGVEYDLIKAIFMRRSRVVSRWHRAAGATRRQHGGRDGVIGLYSHLRVVAEPNLVVEAPSNIMPSTRMRNPTVRGQEIGVGLQELACV